MSSAIVSTGTKLYIGHAGGSAKYSAVAEIQNVEGPNMTRSEIDITNFDTSGGYREYLAGFRDPGRVSFDGNFTAGNTQIAATSSFKAAFDSDANYYWQIRHNPSGGAWTGTWSFQGSAIEYSVTSRTNDAVKFRGAIKVSGQPTFTKTS